VEEIMKIDGACHCGAIAYEAEIDPEMVTVCHCADCQTLSGTAFRVNVFAPEDKFRLTRGTPKAYVKTAESGNKRVQAFCAECGSAIYATSVGEGPKTYGIRVGTARQRAELTPKRQVWHRSAVPWLPEMEGLATKEVG